MAQLLAVIPFITIVWLRAAEAQNCAYTRGDYSISWKVKNGVIKFELTVQDNSQNFWTGVGFGDNMFDLDTHVIVVSNGQIDFRDGHSRRRSAPIDDSSNDLHNTRATYENGVLEASFVRRLNTGDPSDYNLSGSDLKFQFPYNAGRALGRSIGYHRQTPEMKTYSNLATTCPA